jgi:hypothetical protein
MSEKPNRVLQGLASSVKMRTYSPVIFLYPTFVMSLICGVWVSASGATIEDPGSSGIAFTAVFFFNLTVIAFDYTRLTSIVVLLTMVILGLLGTIYPGFRETLVGLFDQKMFMDAMFYWVWSAGLFLVLAGTVIKTRFNYWELKNQELLHHHGILGDIERWPAPNMRISKEITDVMEFALLRSGRLVLVPRGEQRAIVIDNVPGINKIEKQMQDILSTLRVVDGD